jgi:hypothetical protein
MRSGNPLNPMFWLHARHVQQKKENIPTCPPEAGYKIRYLVGRIRVRRGGLDRKTLDPPKVLSHVDDIATRLLTKPAVTSSTAQQPCASRPASRAQSRGSLAAIESGRAQLEAW